MSFQGVVYCMPNHVRHLLSRLAMENHIIDYRLVRASFREDNRSVLADFADMLRDRGLARLPHQRAPTSASSSSSVVVSPPCPKWASLPSR